MSSEINPINIPLDDIYADSEFNCRGIFTNYDVVDLAEDIRENGLLQPVIVVPSNMDGYKYKLIAGFRRFAAVSSLNHQTVPAVVKDTLTELQQRTINLVENIKRKDLNILQESNAIKNLIAAGMTQGQMADRLGVTTGWLQPRLALLKLPEDLQKEAAAGYLTAQHIVDLSKLPTKEQQYDSIKEIRAARERGEKAAIQIIKKKEKKVVEVKLRNVTDIRHIQDVIREAIGNCLATRVCAWAAGNIDDAELYASLKEEADRKGINYSIPADYVKQ